MDASPVGNIRLRCDDEGLEIRNATDSAYKDISFNSLPTGTGASEVAIGNHTHSLTEDVTGSADTSDLCDGGSATYYLGGINIAASGDDDAATVNLTYATISRTVAVAWLSGRCATADDLKLRLIMGGTQQAESAYISTTSEIVQVVGTKAMMGSQDCIARLHNYDSGQFRTLHCVAYHDSSPMAIGIGAGSATI